MEVKPIKTTLQELKQIQKKYKTYSESPNNDRLTSPEKVLNVYTGQLQLTTTSTTVVEKPNVIDSEKLSCQIYEKLLLEYFANGLNNTDLLPLDSYDLLKRIAIWQTTYKITFTNSSLNKLEIALKSLSNIWGPGIILAKDKNINSKKRLVVEKVDIKKLGVIKIIQSAIDSDNPSLLEKALQLKAPAITTATKGAKKRKLEEDPIDDEEFAKEINELLEKPTFIEAEQNNLLQDLCVMLNKKSSKDQLIMEMFHSTNNYFREFCVHGTKTDCKKNRKTARACNRLHFRPMLRPHTELELGDCSYLNTCHRMDTCKYVHYELDDDEEKWAFVQRNEIPSGVVFTPPTKVLPPQWINCDVRKFDFSILGKFTVIMADPPWDIHMTLPYGTMTDDEMKAMAISELQDEGLIFLWVTGRAMELGRECLAIWGYDRADELVWIKTNQLQRLIRTGRTGHWLNHSKEHCLVGIKGNPEGLNWGLDCDVLVGEVRETSRKPDEIYGIIDRLAPGTRKLEIFGRQHNTRPGWMTLGNQLDDVRLYEPELDKERYSKQELVGRGAYGSVYKGIDNETNEVVAIKVLNLDAEEDDVDDIIKEINLLSQLKHESQNITRYYGSFLHGTKLWIIMEYAAGGSIRTLMKSGRIEEKYISSITKEVLQALIYLHKCKIIHRDIKGKVQLCDFGVAGQLTASSSKRTSFVGTPYWMAPEVIIEGATYDMKADIWSLGITVYEIATGNPPYHDQSAMRAIQLIPRNPPAQLEGPYSIPLKEFVSLCLNECPEQRPAADELIKCKFIKSISKHQTGILRDLIARFDLWKQTTGYRQSFSDPYGTPSSESDSCDIGDNDDDEDAWIFDTVQNTANTAIHRKSHSLGSLASNLDKFYGRITNNDEKLSPKRYTYSRKYSENQHPLLQLFNNDDRKQDYNNSLFSNEHSENLFNSHYSSFSQSKNSFSMENGLTNNNNNNNLNKLTDSSLSILKNAQQTQGSNGLLLSSVKPITNKEDSGSSSQGGRQYTSSHHARRVRSATTLNQTNRPNTEELIGQNSLGVYMQRQRATSIGGGNIQKSPKAKPIFAIQSSQIIKDGPELRQLKMDNYRGTNEVYEDLSKTTDDFLQWMLLLDAGINQLLTRF
ncbi:7310_t:CDS:10 [Entrophospora sp. SA101]|nr:7310_t:CDS:10 [Entrophospora sp. SA101]